MTESLDGRRGGGAVGLHLAAIAFAGRRLWPDE